jgi:hypothetical protein
MRISRIGLVGAVAAAMVASGAGFAVAGASTVRPAASTNETFNLMSTVPTASKYVVIASGKFTAGGTDISGSSTDLVKFSNGTFKIDHGTAIHIIKENLNPKTCLAVFEATAKFTLIDGTGAYKHISGSGKAVVSGLFIAPRSKGQCNPNGNPSVSEETITASAHVSL